MNAPLVTRADLQRLLDSPGENPVLYLKAGPDDEGGELEVDVWVEVYVRHTKIVARRSEVVDVIGADPDDDAIDHYLTELQQTAEDVAGALTEPAELAVDLDEVHDVN